ncbi:MAG: hypothetical protein REI64_07880 [Pedobacter sp.]|nr:hypothetical protein [Pedobacter sp.]MDQ8004704.1 hypothetical protein [Pedobacter sp.]
MNFRQNDYLAIAISAPSYSLPFALADGQKSLKILLTTPDGNGNPATRV